MFSGAQVRNKKKTQRICRQSRRRSRPTSHKQKSPTWLTKPTNPALALNIWHQEPPGSDPEKDGGQRRQNVAGRTVGSSEPRQAPVQVHFGGMVDLMHYRSVMSVSMYRECGNRPQTLYKGPPTTLSLTHTPLGEASLSLSLWLVLLRVAELG